MRIYIYVCPSATISLDSALHMYEPEENPTPDDDVFRHLATVYAKNHATMWMGTPCKQNMEKFPGGIVNGAKWYTVIGNNHCRSTFSYSVMHNRQSRTTRTTFLRIDPVVSAGGMQDYNYIFHGTMEITLEVSCCKHPMASTLKQHWQDNRKVNDESAPLISFFSLLFIRHTMSTKRISDCQRFNLIMLLNRRRRRRRQALILYMYEALRGVKGFVNDEDSGQPLPGVQLRIKGRERSFNTTTFGEYWRILLNGTYILQVPPICAQDSLIYF